MIPELDHKLLDDLVTMERLHSAMRELERALSNIEDRAFLNLYKESGNELPANRLNRVSSHATFFRRNIIKQRYEKYVRECKEEERAKRGEPVRQIKFAK